MTLTKKKIRLISNLNLNTKVTARIWNKSMIWKVSNLQLMKEIVCLSHPRWIPLTWPQKDLKVNFTDISNKVQMHNHKKLMA